METVDVTGPKNMVYRVRRSMRIAIYRPSLVDGDTVVSTDQTFSYPFPYIQEIEAEDLDPANSTELPPQTEETEDTSLEEVKSNA